MTQQTGQSMTDSDSAQTPTDTTDPWGIGVRGTLDPVTVGELAGSVEDLGYSSFWFNVIGTEVDVVAHFAHAVEATRSIEIGVGVVPLDVQPPQRWVPRMAQEALDLARVIVGVGAGTASTGQLQSVRSAIELARGHLPHTRLAVGTARPRMLQLTAQAADAVVFSMLDAAGVSRAVTTMAQTPRPNPVTPYVYHRVAEGPDAERLLLEEMTAHGVDIGPTVSASHPPILGSISDNAEDLAGKVSLCGYERSARIVLRPVVDWNDTSAVRERLQRLSPWAISNARR